MKYVGLAMLAAGIWLCSAWESGIIGGWGFWTGFGICVAVAAFQYIAGRKENNEKFKMEN